MNDNNQILVLRDNAKHELMQLKSVEDGITYMNKLKSIEVWVKAEKKDAELQNIVAEQKLRTQRILGELIAESTRKNIGSNQWEPPQEPTLKEHGISKKQSSTFQAIASIPEETFEDFIQEKKEAVKNAVAELTTTGAVRLAKSLQEKKKDLDDHLERQTQLDAEKELKKIAQNINMTYTKEQRRFFVNLIKV